MEAERGDLFNSLEMAEGNIESNVAESLEKGPDDNEAIQQSMEEGVAESQEMDFNVSQVTDEEDIQSSDTQSSRASTIHVDTLLEKLPAPEVQELIMDRLDLEDKMLFRLVSSKWEEWMNKLMYWSPRLWDESANSILKFAQKQIPVDTLTISKLEEFEYPPSGIGITSVRKLHFIPYREGAEEYGISDENLTKLLKEFHGVKEVFLHSGQFRKVVIPSALRSATLNELEFIEISGYNADGHGLNVCADILYNQFPSLKKIQFCFLNAEESPLEQQHPLFYKQVFQFIARHHSTLHKIELKFDNLKRVLPPMEQSALFDFPIDLENRITRDEFNELERQLKNLQLDTFLFHPTFYAGNYPYSLGSGIILNQRHLVNLTVTNLSVGNSQLCSIVKEAIEKNAATLKTVGLQGCFCAEVPNDVSFSCNILKNCSQLEKLDVQLCSLKVQDTHAIPQTVKYLNLGSLTKIQIDGIIENLPLVSTFRLIQGGSETDPNIPKVSVDMFQKIIKMPSLTTLSLHKKHCHWKSIRKFIHRKKDALSWERSDPDEDDDDNVEITFISIFINNRQKVPA